jgi:hypothetical protein
VAVTGSGALRRVEADPWGDGCATGFVLREDFAADLEALRGEVRRRGGVLTSSGGLRRLEAEVTAARSPVSLHYLGRAIDLCIRTGMRGPDDPYLVVPDAAATADPDRPVWRVWCAGGTAGDEVTVEARLWRAGVGTTAHRRTGVFFDLTALFEAGGWSRVPARPGWQESYFCVEWWHLERRDGLVPGVTTFGDELRRLYPPEAIARSRLGGVLDRVWNGRWFAPPEGEG